MKKIEEKNFCEKIKKSGGENLIFVWDPRFQ